MKLPHWIRLSSQDLTHYNKMEWSTFFPYLNFSLVIKVSFVKSLWDETAIKMYPIQLDTWKRMYYTHRNHSEMRCSDNLYFSQKNTGLRIFHEKRHLNILKVTSCHSDLIILLQGCRTFLFHFRCFAPDLHAPEHFTSGKLAHTCISM